MKKNYLTILASIMLCFMLVLTGCSTENAKLEIEIVNNSSNEYYVCMSKCEDEADCGVYSVISSGDYEYNGEMTYPWGSLVIGECNNVTITLDGVDISDRIISVEQTDSLDVKFTKNGYVAYNFNRNSKCIVGLFDELKAKNKNAKLVITLS